MFEMRDQVVDQTFRFNELENRTVELKIPPVWKNSKSMQRDPAFNPEFAISYKKATLELKDNSDALVKMRTRDAPNRSCFNVLLYENKFRAKLLHNYAIEVTSMKGRDVNIETGQRITEK